MGFWKRIADGLAEGVKAGRKANTQTGDLLTGRAFFRHSSGGDAAAGQIEELREEQRQGREEQREAMERLARALEKRNE